MKIDLNTLLGGEEYEPRVGAEYEVAPGVWGKMMHPTIGFQNEVLELGQADDTTDFILMKKILSLPDIKEEECLPLVPSKAVADFFFLLRLTMKRLKEISAAFEAETSKA